MGCTPVPVFPLDRLQKLFPLARQPLFRDPAPSSSVSYSPPRPYGTDLRLIGVTFVVDEFHVDGFLVFEFGVGWLLFVMEGAEDEVRFVEGV